MLVWGGISFTDPAAGGNVVGRPSSGVAYDPARRSWRQLPALPEELRSLRSDHWTAWTGRELLVGGVREAEAGGVTVAGYDPAANRRRRLPQSPGLTGGPGHLQARTAIWSGNRLLVWSFWTDTARAADDLTEPLPRPDAEPDGIDLWAYDPAGDRWTVLPAPPAEVRQAAAQASMIWTARDVLVAAPRVVKVAGKDRTATVAGPYIPTAPAGPQSPGCASARSESWSWPGPERWWWSRSGAPSTTPPATAGRAFPPGRTGRAPRHLAPAAWNAPCS
jgi:hypothetical protein